jgi:hypothetical protein
MDRDKAKRKLLVKQNKDFTPFKYIIPQFCPNAQYQRLAAEELYKVVHEEDGKSVKLIESTRIGEEQHTLELTSVKATLESGTGLQNETKERRIEYDRKKGHPGYHLHLKVVSADSTKIVIQLDGLDKDDYYTCIKGFIKLSKMLLEKEKQEYKKKDIVKYFFNDAVEDLEPQRKFLVGKILEAERKNLIFDENNKPIKKPQLEAVKREKHLSPFFDVS